MDEVLELLNQKFARSKRSQGASLRRSTRNIKESLARTKRYNSGSLVIFTHKDLNQAYL